MVFDDLLKVNVDKHRDHKVLIRLAYMGITSCELTSAENWTTGPWCCITISQIEIHPFMILTNKAEWPNRETLTISAQIFSLKKKYIILIYGLFYTRATQLSMRTIITNVIAFKNHCYKCDVFKKYLTSKRFSK